MVLTPSRRMRTKKGALSMGRIRGESDLTNAQFSILNSHPKGQATFVVLGGSGAIGRIVVRDLFESNRKNRVVVADFNSDAAAAYARSFRSSRITAAQAD